MIFSVPLMGGTHGHVFRWERPLDPLGRGGPMGSPRIARSWVNSWAIFSPSVAIAGSRARRPSTAARIISRSIDIYLFGLVSDLFCNNFVGPISCSRCLDVSTSIKIVDRHLRPISKQC